MSTVRIATLPWCTAILPEPWDAPAGRLYVAWTARGAWRWFLGQGVIDEFGTLSSPIFVTPASLLGTLYDTGIALGFARGTELALDAGWPPIVLGVDAPAPSLPPGWEERTLAAIRDPGSATGDGGLRPTVERLRPSDPGLERIRISGVTVLVTDAPLLPHQLRRLTQGSPGDFVLGVSTGNRVLVQEGGAPQSIRVASEATLEDLVAVAGSRPGTSG